jgi:DNA-binding MarR family transcriptional regulator
MKERTKKGIVAKVGAVIRNRKTYQIGLLQAKAYRILKQHTSNALEHLNISTTEWALLGFLNDQPKAIRANVVAEVLGVEPPFVTVLIKKLEKQGLLSIEADASDNRSKLIELSAKGTAFVGETELYVRDKMRPLAQGTGLTDIAGYVAVLERIIENASQDEKGKK